MNSMPAWRPSDAFGNALTLHHRTLPLNGLTAPLTASQRPISRLAPPSFAVVVVIKVPCKVRHTECFRGSRCTRRRGRRFSAFLFIIFLYSSCNIMSRIFACPALRFLRRQNTLVQADFSVLVCTARHDDIRREAGDESAHLTLGHTEPLSKMLVRRPAIPLGRA